MINTVVLTGHLGTQPGEVKTAARTIVKARFAAYNGKNRESMWLDLTAWSEWSAKDLLKCAKSDRVTVSGRLECSHWIDKDGKEWQTWGLSVQSIDRHAQVAAPAPQKFANQQELTEDIPF